MDAALQIRMWIAGNMSKNGVERKPRCLQNEPVQKMSVAEVSHLCCNHICSGTQQEAQEGGQLLLQQLAQVSSWSMSLLTFSNIM